VEKVRWEKRTWRSLYSVEATRVCIFRLFLLPNIVLYLYSTNKLIYFTRCYLLSFDKFFTNVCRHSYHYNIRPNGLVDNLTAVQAAG